MVNTFLTSSPHDVDPKTGKKGYRISASHLDKTRLWKQALEALQILNLVESFHILGKMFSNPCPKNPYQVKAWTKEIMKTYKELDSYVFFHQGKYVWYPKKSSKNSSKNSSKKYPKPKKIKYDDEYQILEDGKIEYKGKIYPKYGLILPGDNFFSMGFWSHPCVVMWMHHPESLKLYINEHINEFIERGGKKDTEKLKCRLKLSKEGHSISHPIWTLDSMFHLNHKAALLTKEIERKEPAWYIKKRDFKEAYNYYLREPETNPSSTSSFKHYIWVFTQDLDEPRYQVVEEDGEYLLSIKTISKSKNLILV